MKKIAFIVSVIISVNSMAQEQATRMQFDHYNVQQGLSQGWVTSIYQDFLGFMWFGTNDGLNRFDGYTFKVYKHNPKSNRSLRNNNVNKIIEIDKELWLATSSGLCRFNRAEDIFYFDTLWPEIYISDIKCINKKLIIASESGLYYLETDKNAFQRFRINGQDVLSELVIYSLAVNKKNEIWIGTNQGLFLLSDSFSKLTPVIYLADFNQINRNISISSIEIDSSNRVWVGTETRGLFMIEYDNANSQKFNIVNYKNNKQKSRSINEGMIRSIHADSKGNIWFGIENGGLNYLKNNFDKNDPVFEHFLYDPKVEKGISSNSVYAIHEDLRGDIWIGTYGGGINYYNNSGKYFMHFHHAFESQNSLINNNVNIFYPYQNDIWIGTEGGISVFDPLNFSFKTINHNTNSINSLSANSVWAITSDSEGKLWIGTWGGGVCKLDTKTSNFKLFKPGLLPNNNIFWIEEDSDEFLWIGTMGGGLVRYSKKGDSLMFYMNNTQNPYSIADNFVQLIFENSRKELWISTSSSLELFNKEKNEFIHFQSNFNDSKSFTGRGAQVIFEDSKHTMWFGTDAGLNYFNRNDSTFICYQESDGLPNNSIKGILEDRHGNIWLSTNRGISKMINGTDLPIKPEFRNYDVNDGLQGNEFNRRAAFSDKNGWMYFGGTNGFNVFHPDSLKENNYIPPIVFTNFLVANKPVNHNLKGSPIEKDISIADKIVLKYSQTVFTIEFAALNYINSEKNQYAYLLEGFDNDWNLIGNKRTANYTNVDPGEYIFRVKASNNDGIWNKEGISITIVILPPWYRTVWAYSFYILFLIFLFMVFRRFILIRARLQHEIEVKQIEKERLDELYQMKTRFYTNISHEFRTPLTLIIGPLEKLLVTTNFKLEVKQQFEIILKNARRMLRLINQFMDMSKIEAGYVKMIVHEGDLSKYISAIANIFQYQANDKKIEYSFKVNYKSFNAWFDSDKIEKILYNLLSNAIKYTPLEGKVDFIVRFNKPDSKNKYPGYVEFWVKDTGIGISPDEQQRIFDRFYQADNTANIKNTGTGIGLSLAHGLVNKYGGVIELKSEQGKGTEFYFRLPFTRDKFDESWIVSKSEDEYMGKLESEYFRPELSPESEKAKSSEITANNNLPILLIVEDNADLIHFIADHFKTNFNVLYAYNGNEGIKIARERIPDIIISDIMMPDTDGIELCRNLKSHEKTSHIPIIIISAKASDESQIEGLETGADDFLTKPFNINVLEVRINNLLESRKKLKNTFSHKINIEPKDISITSVDAKFIQKAIDLVEMHMADADYNVDQMSRDIGMSRASLHRKMIALTDLPPSGFIRAMRLKRAARLLIEGQHTVSEVLYEVGIKSRSYFTKSFKEMFGKLPTEYVASSDKSINDANDLINGLDNFK